MRLFLSNIKLGRGGLITWACLILLYGLFAVYLFPVVSKSTMDYIKYISALPEAMRTAVGLGNTDISSLAFTADTYVAIEFLMFWPIIVCFYAIFAGVGIAREAERGTLELLMAQPIGRNRVLMTKYAALLTGVLVISLASWLGVALGIPLVHESINLAYQALALMEGCCSS